LLDRGGELLDAGRSRKRHPIFSSTPQSPSDASSAPRSGPSVRGQVVSRQLPEERRNAREYAPASAAASHRSPNTNPASTLASWSLSPTSTMRACGGTAANNASISTDRSSTLRR
jgi:hypothetical protein